jgi:ribosomal protein L3 glutamine methyltransferase
MTVPSELLTVRDFLRYAVSQFRAAKIVHGHGTTRVLDEAAFIILEALHLPVDDINPWLDSRLLKSERATLARLITARVKTRKPAAYLLKKAYMHGIPFHVDERVIVPRSYIGDLLMDGTLGPDGVEFYETPAAIRRVLDLCTGSGCLAVLAAMTFENASVDAVDLSKDALAVARLNVKEHAMEERIRLLQGDLFAPVKDQRYDLIIANPPYVAKAEVKAFPPEYKHEPVMAHLGGDDGFDIVRRILKDVPRHLSKTGVLVCEIGTGRDLLEADFPKLPFIWLDTEESEGEVFALRASDLPHKT